MMDTTNSSQNGSMQPTFSLNNIDQKNSMNANMSLYPCTQSFYLDSDVDIILRLQKQTDSFHQHLSYFINTHLPQLPDTMELMDRLTYDFNAGTSLHNASNDVNMSNGNPPSLEREQQNGAASQSQINALTQSLNLYKKQYEAANAEQLQWKTKYIELDKENKALKQRLSLMENQLIGTRAVAINGAGPRLDNLKFIKPEIGASNDESFSVNYKRTQGVEELRERVTGKYDTSKWKIEGDEDLYDYFDSILSFLNENEENVVIPNVLFPNEERMNMSKEDSDDDDDDEENEYLTRLQTECLEKFRITNNVRVPSLNGQFGVRATMNIPKSTVVGQYIGVEYLESEFHAAYAGTTESALKNIYAFNLSVGDNPTNSNKANGRNQNVPKIVIDAHGFECDAKGDKPMLIFVNDCRSDISVTKTSEDEKVENVLFAKVSLNGWPSIFVITKRNILRGEELFGFYGNDYFHALKEKELQERIRNRNQTIIDQNVLQGQFNLNHNKVNLM